jgi:TRAP transporter TAXI family solute receptor
MPTAKKKKPRQSSGQFGSATKTLAVLRAFIDLQDRWGVRELAHALDQPISSTHRLLQILRADALVDWDAVTQQYTIGREAYRWAAALGERFELLELGRAAAGELARASGHGAALAVLDAPRARIFFAAQIEGPGSLAMHGPAGRVEAILETPAGWVLVDALPEAQRRAILNGAAPALARRLERIEQDGFGFADADTAAGRPAIIAAPVPGARGTPGASLVLSLQGARPAAAEMRELGSLVRDHARRLGERMGMRLLSGSAGGASHPGVAAIVGLVKERLPDLRLVARETHGQRNLTALEDGQAAYCTAVLGSLESAFLGAAPYGVPHRRLRLVAGLAPLLLHVVVRADSAVRTFQDVLGARVSPGERDYATAQVFSELADLAAASRRQLERALARAVYLDYVEAHREFEAGKIDVLISLNSVPNPAYLRIGGELPLRLISLDEGLIHRYAGSRPFYAPAHIPGGIYPRSLDSIRTLKTSLVMVTTEDRPEAEVRALVQAIHEGHERLVQVAPGFATVAADLLPPGCSVPLHPGARRYWTQAGMLG